MIPFRGNLKHILISAIVMVGLMIFYSCGSGRRDSGSKTQNNQDIQSNTDNTDNSNQEDQTSDNTGNVSGNAFQERWEGLTPGTYIPAEMVFINGDAGEWSLGDTVAEFEDCGPTPNTAEIIDYNGGNALRLTSGYSDGCADNIWIALWDTGAPLNYNSGFAVPISEATRISFREEGELDDPQASDYGNTCSFPPCYDNISLMIQDNNYNILAYVFQHPADATPVEDEENYYEIFIDSEEDFHSRNLFDDFSLMRDFNPYNATIQSLEFKISEHGWAIIDDLTIGTQN